MKSTVAMPVASLLLAVVFHSVEAAEPLAIGDPAPPLKTGRWVQGDPVKAFEKDKAYIVEFWATWCGPCRVSIPHLNELHNKFKDKGLVVIGQDCWERDESLVEPFIKKMGDKMTYRVALDDKSTNEKGNMAETWMTAAEQNGIPAAFLVGKDGKIAWIGHPMSLKEETIEEVLAGTFDTKKAAEEARIANESQKKIQEHAKALTASMRAKEWDKAEESLQAIDKLLPEDQKLGIDMTRLQILLGKADFDSAYKLAAKVSDAHQDNPMLNAQLARTLATQEEIKEPNVPLLQRLASRAEASKEKNAFLLDTLARVKFIAGKRDEAVEMQQKAIDAADDDGMKSSMKKTLESYKEGKLPSTH